jgi:hypothetical protein
LDYGSFDSYVKKLRVMRYLRGIEQIFQPSSARTVRQRKKDAGEKTRTEKPPGTKALP